MKKALAGAAGVGRGGEPNATSQPFHNTGIATQGQSGGLWSTPDARRGFPTLSSHLCCTFAWHEQSVAAAAHHP
ncbi:MAG TPA: hypothetical protein VGS41_16295, partial [Chthonomonadales bacterium]|nr:hypothetical protein [Chthonomonadales bacterium]